MLVIPAVDLLEGRAVRLAGGERERATIYSDAPWELAAEFARAGAKRIHVVDLDGAFAGRPVQLDLIRRLLDAARSSSDDCELEVGGGIREAASVEALFDAGADKVVVGTLAVREPQTVAALCRAHPQGIVVAIDARDGMVAVEGWRETSRMPALDLARDAAQWGAAGLLYTDVARDGLQVGAAVEATAALQAQVPIDVIASGGVATLADLDALRDAGIRAVVLGRALYERNFTFPEALARC
jgi:phosphoribosylformimino-5-aminoimidazole carboxamide ribotide isomerase